MLRAAAPRVGPIQPPITTASFAPFRSRRRRPSKRNTSVARVILRPGDGATWFNGRTVEQYFPRATHRELALAPLKVAGVEGTFDVRVRVHGGGPSGQAGAVRHGVARALVEADPELRVPLKRAGFL